MGKFKQAPNNSGARQADLARNKIVRAVVISLPGSDRLPAFMERNGSQFVFEVHDAYDARTGGGDEFFDKARAEQIVQRELKGGEVGCAISHLQVLREFATEPGNDTDLLLVAEDDARLDADAFKVISRARKRLKQIDYLILSEAWGGKDMGSWISLKRNPSWRLGNMSLRILPLGPVWNPLEHRVGHVSNDVWGTGLYLISRSAAKSYVGATDEHGRSYWTADLYHYWATKANVDILVCRPGVCDWEGESQVDNERAFDPSRIPAAKSRAELVRNRVALRTRWARFKGSLRATQHELQGGSFPFSDK